MSSRVLLTIKNIVVGLLILFFFGRYLRYVDAVSFNIPHSDAWLGLANTIVTYMDGPITFNTWFPIPHGEYFSLLYVPIYSVVFKVFDLDYQKMTYAASVFLLIESIVLYKAFNRSFSAKSTLEKFFCGFLFFFILMAIYNLNQWEIASYYCSFEFFLRISFYCYMFSYIDRLLHKEEKILKEYVIAGLLCFVAIIVISHAYFPGAIGTVALIMIYDYLRKGQWKQITYYAVVALFVIIGGGIYIATYNFGQPSNIDMSASVDMVAKITEFVEGYLLMIGTTLLHTSSGREIQVFWTYGVLNILVSFVCSVLYMKKKEHNTSYMPLMLMLYGYITAAIITFIRLQDFEVEYLIASRYVVETTLILIANMWMMIVLVGDALNNVVNSRKCIRNIITAGVFIGLLISTADMVYKTNDLEWRMAPDRRAYFKVMAYNILNMEFATDEDLQNAQSSPTEVRKAVEQLEKYQLSVFADFDKSEELQKLEMENLPENTYSIHSGVHWSEWVTGSAALILRTGEDEQITLRGSCPVEISGEERITVTVGERSEEYSITQSEFEIQIPVPKNELVKLILVCDFETESADYPGCFFALKGIDGYTKHDRGI